MRLGYVLVSIVVACLGVALDAPLALFRMRCVSFFSVDAARRRDLLRSRTSPVSRDPVVVLLESQAAQEALVNWLRRGL